ncbi:phage tail sheath family protein [Sphingomonas sp. ERG5]|uniref:phage tail sheath family protein n=1 Tax=Sphingomonas sp. ERG5 TaxID=1381597 RepID=UPI000690C6C3|nr:phage tail sheath C-terminal domain-containing protein [Sphingomonas sp. ERG5]
MTYNIGLNVVEVDGTGAPAIPGAATSVAAFNILTKRGPAQKAVRIGSFAEFEQQFGSHFAQGLGSYLVKGFFDNDGATAYVNRVVATGGGASTPARRTLLDTGPVNTLTLEAGARGVADPGSWGLGIYVKTTRRSLVSGLRLNETAAATVVTAGALPAATDMVAAAFPSLIVTVDNAPGATTVTFNAAQFANPAAATRAEILAAINAGTNDFDASFDGGNQLRLTSTGNIAMTNGGFTRLAVAANATLGFAAPVNADATIAALGTNGATLQSVSGLNVGDAIQFDDGTAPPPERAKVMTINPVTRAITWAPAVTPANYTVTALRIATLEFDLEVYLGGTDPGQNLKETWPGLSMEGDVDNYAITRLNHPTKGSGFVRAIDEHSATPIGNDRPANMPAALALNTGGVDGVATSNDFIGDQSTRTGFYAFDPLDVQLLTCERTDPAIAEAGISYCEARDDCMYVGAVPDGSIEGGTALAYGQALQGTKRYGALYGPWITVADTLPGAPPTKSIPPVGHVMGVYARIERTRGIWKAPAGDEARLRNALDVSYRLSDNEHSQLVREGSINGIRALPRAGIVVDASRTLSSDPRWYYVNVRLLFNYVKSSLRAGLRWVRQEPNRDTLWNLVTYGSIRPFLMRLWRQGAFGTGTPAHVFTVICDATNNPPSQVQLGFLNVEIYFYPSVPAETIVVKVGQQPSGETSSDA